MSVFFLRSLFLNQKYAKTFTALGIIKSDSLRNLFCQVLTSTHLQRKRVYYRWRVWPIFLGCCDGTAFALPSTSQSSIPFAHVQVRISWDLTFICTTIKKWKFFRHVLIDCKLQVRKSATLFCVEQWFSTAGPRTGTRPRRFFAGPQKHLGLFVWLPLVTENA